MRLVTMLLVLAGAVIASVGGREGAQQGLAANNGGTFRIGWAGGVEAIDRRSSARSPRRKLPTPPACGS